MNPNVQLQAVNLDGQGPAYLGQLLLRADLIDRNQLEVVGGLADRPPERLGQKLVLAGYISHSELHDVLHVQCLLREEAIEESDALKILRLVRQDGISAEQAVVKLTLELPESKPNSRFGDLLIDAQILSRDELEDALERSASTNLPLGCILEKSGMVSREILSLVRDVQQAIRAKAITRQCAVHAIAAAVAKPVEEEKIVEQEIVSQPAVALPRIPEAPPMPPLPGFTKKPVCAAEPAIAPGYKLLPAQDPHFRETTSHKRDSEIGFAEFLVLCCLINKEDVKRAEKMCDGTKFGIESVIKKIHQGKQAWIELAGHCFKQVRTQRMTLDEAIYAFDHGRRAVEANRCTLAEAINGLESLCGLSLN
jgi:hypothetical protein